MKSYYHEGSGLLEFLEKTEEVKEVMMHNLVLEHGPDFPENMRRYPELIDYIRDHADRLFEYEPMMLFQIHLALSPKALFIRVKNIQGQIITILTIYFSTSVSATETRCQESLRWSFDALHYIFGNSPKAPR